MIAIFLLIISKNLCLAQTIPLNSPLFITSQPTTKEEFNYILMYVIIILSFIIGFMLGIISHAIYVKMTSAKSYTSQIDNLYENL